MINDDWFAMRFKRTHFQFSTTFLTSRSFFRQCVLLRAVQKKVVAYFRNGSDESRTCDQCYLTKATSIYFTSILLISIIATIIWNPLGLSSGHCNKEIWKENLSCNLLQVASVLVRLLNKVFWIIHSRLGLLLVLCGSVRYLTTLDFISGNPFNQMVDY